MTYTDTTLEGLVTQLGEVAPDQPLIFMTDAGEIGAGYHVTELKHLRVDSIDCGGRRSNWHEAQLQLLDGDHGGHMHVGKFIDIARRSMGAIDGLGHTPLSVEYAHKNQGLHRYRIGALVSGADGLRLTLVADTAICKPAMATPCPLGRQPRANTKKADQMARPKTDCCALR